MRRRLEQRIGNGFAVHIINTAAQANSMDGGIVLLLKKLPLI